MSKSLSSLDIVLELKINAPVDTVWTSLVDQIGEWWPKDFYVGSAPKRISIEPRVGGLVYEDWGDGQGVVWGQILTLESGRRIQWVGDMTAEYGGPARSITTYTLSADGEKTSLTFRDTPYGALSETALADMTEGWTYLMERCFQVYVETGVRPERPPTMEA